MLIWSQNKVFTQKNPFFATVVSVSKLTNEIIFWSLISSICEPDCYYCKISRFSATLQLVRTPIGWTSYSQNPFGRTDRLTICCLTERTFDRMLLGVVTSSRMIFGRTLFGRMTIDQMSIGRRCSIVEYCLAEFCLARCLLVEYRLTECLLTDCRLAEISIGWQPIVRMYCSTENHSAEYLAEFYLVEGQLVKLFGPDRGNDNCPINNRSNTIQRSVDLPSIFKPQCFVGLRECWYYF